MEKKSEKGKEREREMGEGAAEKVSIRMLLSVACWLDHKTPLSSSLSKQSVLTLELSPDLKKAFWLCSIYRVRIASKNTPTIDCPINGELPARLAKAGSSKKKRTNNRGKGRLDRVERLKKHSEKPTDMVGW